MVEFKLTHYTKIRQTLIRVAIVNHVRDISNG